MNEILILCFFYQSETPINNSKKVSTFKLFKVTVKLNIWLFTIEKSSCDVNLSISNSMLLLGFNMKILILLQSLHNNQCSGRTHFFNKISTMHHIL